THRPLYYDDKLGLWVASSARIVTAVLTSELCKVRPATEPIPKALLGSPAAEIFRRLVRMNDGEGHCPFKQAVSATLASTDRVWVVQQSSKSAQFLLDESGSMPVSEHLSRFAFHLPVYVAGGLLGIPQDRLHQTALWLRDFVRCLAPSSSPEQIES